MSANCSAFVGLALGAGAGGAGGGGGGCSGTMALLLGAGASLGFCFLAVRADFKSFFTVAFRLCSLFMSSAFALSIAFLLVTF